MGEERWRCGLAIPSGGGDDRPVFVTCGTCTAADLLWGRCPELVVYDPSGHNLDEEDDSDGYGGGYPSGGGQRCSACNGRLAGRVDDLLVVPTWSTLSLFARRVLRPAGVDDQEGLLRRHGGNPYKAV